MGLNEGPSKSPEGTLVDKSGDSAQESCSLIYFFDHHCCHAIPRQVFIENTAQIGNLFLARDFCVINFDLEIIYKSFRECLDPKRIDSVLPRCRDSLLSVSQVRILVTSELRASSTCNLSSLEIRSAESRVCSYRHHSCR